MAKAKKDDATAVEEKIGELTPHVEIARKLHDIIGEAAPELQPRLWYGMPGYAKTKSSPVICFFRVDDGFMTFGLTEKANLTPDPDSPYQLVESAWFVNGMDDATAEHIAALVKRAAS